MIALGRKPVARLPTWRQRPAVHLRQGKRMKDLGIWSGDRKRGSTKYPARMMLAMSIMLWSTYEGRWRNVISLSRGLYGDRHNHLSEHIH
jgi:hypothetical protein